MHTPRLPGFTIEQSGTGRLLAMRARNRPLAQTPPSIRCLSRIRCQDATLPQPLRHPPSSTALAPPSRSRLATQPSSKCGRRHIIPYPPRHPALVDGAIATISQQPPACSHLLAHQRRERRPLAAQAPTRSLSTARYQLALARPPLARSPLDRSPLASSPLACSQLARSPLASSPHARSPLASSRSLAPRSLALARSPLARARSLPLALARSPLAPALASLPARSLPTR